MSHLDRAQEHYAQAQDAFNAMAGLFVRTPSARNWRLLVAQMETLQDAFTEVLNRKAAVLEQETAAW